MTRRKARSTLWLAVATPEGAHHDLSLELQEATTSRAVLDALRAHLHLHDDDLELVVARTGEALPPDTVFPALPIGDVLRLQAPGSASLPSSASGGAFEMEVCGGPLLGTRVPLTSGEHLIGRGSGADVKLGDPAMSRLHLQVVVTANGVTVTDAGSSNGTFIDGIPITQPRPVAPGEIVEAGSSLLTFQPSERASRPSTSTTSMGPTVGFNRPPRIRVRAVRTDHSLGAPPELGDPPRLPLAASLIPLVLGVILVALFPANKVMLLFFAFSPVMAIWSVIEQRRTGRKTFGARAEAFRTSVAERERELETAQLEATRQRRILYPGAAELLQWATDVSPRLWERRAGDEDFLHVRVGWDDEPSGFDLGIAEGGDPKLRAEAAARVERFSVLPSVPVVVGLREAGVTAVSGPPGDVRGLCRWMVAQCAVMQSPDDLVISACVADDPPDEWSWLKWLPHVSLGDPLRDHRLVAAGAHDSTEVLSRVCALIESRRGTSSGYGSDVRAGPTVLLVLDGSLVVPRELVTRALREGPAVGIIVLWIGQDAQHLPGETKAIVDVNTEEDRVTVTYPAEGITLARSGPDILSNDISTRIGRALAPVRDVSRLSGTGELPPTVDLVEVVPATSAREIEARWGEHRGLVAPIGRGSTGMFSLDLRRDGPHCLIGGTTGAGKSELLQTAVAALAATYPATKLNFILLDYKGGTAFKDCVQLPHVVGSVTDLDGSLARRALISLEAELKRRETILRDAGARDLLEMESVLPAEAPPHLVLVIDEFATLIKELPDFVDGIVDVAQRGRGLGINLILATQRPAGVVNEKIRANTNLRICLRVGDESDSSDVIGVPDAARIERSLPGRAYARVGHAEVVPFQAAFGGRPGPAVDEPVVIVPFHLSAPPRAAARGTDDGATQLQEVVTAIVEAGRAHPRPRQPWLPPLPERIALGDLEPSSATSLTVGMIDDPERQRRRPYTIDLDAVGSVLVYGTAASGKTTLLRTIACAIAGASSPAEVNLYGLDFSTHGLRVLEELPHCGSVIAGDDEERVQRLFSMIRREVTERRELLAQRGVASLRELGGDVPVPKIVVLLDGYSAFASAFEKVNLGEVVDLLPRLVADGRQLGIHFVITADRRAAVPGAIASLVQTRVVLRLADEDEYSAVGVDLRAARGTKLPPGRGFVEGGSLMQGAIVVDEGAAELEAIARLGDELRDRYGDRAPAVRLLPAEVETGSLGSPVTHLAAALGLDEELETAVADLSESHFVVAGPYRSGRTQALITMVRSLRTSTPGATIHLLAPRRSALTDLDAWASAAHGVEECESSLAALAARPGDGDQIVIIVIDDGDELLESTGAFALEKLVRSGRDGNVRVVAALENHALRRSFGGWGAEIRKDKHGLLLDPDHDVDGDLLGCRLPRRPKKPFPPGRGYLVRRGAFTLIQVAKD